MWSLHIYHYELYFLFYNFILYSFFGWIYESCLVSVQKKTLVNRGFLNGPVIPIYGAGATIIYMFLTPVKESAVFVFLGGMVLASFLEFFTSYVMEKLFHAKWWDYSNMKFNFQGRICLLASLFWGFLSIFMTELLQPLMNKLIGYLKRPAADYLAYFILAVFLFDLAATVISTVKLDRAIANMQKIREELEAYIGSTQLYEAKEEWKQKLEQMGMPEWISNFREVLEDKMKVFDQRSGSKPGLEKKRFREEVEEKIHRFSERYQNNMGRRHFIQKRLLKAFPNLHYANRESAFRDFKDKLLNKQKR